MRSAMVAANSCCAASSAATLPRSTKITCRPERSSVSGPNIGCSEVTLQPCERSARSPARSGDFSEPISKMTPGGRRSARSFKMPSVMPSGVASTMKSCCRSLFLQSSMTVPPGRAAAGSATSTAKPCEERKSTNHRPMRPAPPMTSTRRPLPAPCAATLARSWVVSDERMRRRKRSSARAGASPSSAAAARTPRTTSRSRS